MKVIILVSLGESFAYLCFIGEIFFIFFGDFYLFSFPKIGLPPQNVGFFLTSLYFSGDFMEEGFRLVYFNVWYCLRSKVLLNWLFFSSKYSSFTVNLSNYFCIMSNFCLRVWIASNFLLIFLLLKTIFTLNNTKKFDKNYESASRKISNFFPLIFTINK